MLKAFVCIVSFIGMWSSLLAASCGVHNTHIAFEGDYVLLQRSNSYNKHLASAAGGPLHYPVQLLEPNCAKEVGKPFIETKDLIQNMKYDTGFSIAVKIFPSLHSTWEGRMLGGFAWTGKQTKQCLENINLDGTVADPTRDYKFASRVKAIYLSNMYTYELNYWHHITPRYTDHFSVSWLAGFRYFNIDEKIKMYFHKDYRTSLYSAKVYNDSFGLQLGGNVEYNPYSFLTWGVVIKGGALFNRDKNKTKMFDDNNTIEIRDFDKRGSNFAYCGEIYPFIELRPTKHFYFNINYRVLYVGAIATADRNIVLHGSGQILDHNGYILYHGITGGIQFNF